MKGIIFSVLGLAAMISVGCGGAAAQTTAHPGDMRIIVEGQDRPAQIAVATGGWLSGSAAQTRIFVGADGQTYVGVWVEVPDTGTVVARAPVALSLVVDTSGSMEGQKIAHARMAATSMLESLADGDLVSLYAFSNSVTEIAPPTPLSPHTRAMLNQQIQGLAARGGTNMYDGIRVGEEQLARSPQSHPVRRLVVISDGQANVGPSDPASLGQLASNGTEWGVQVTAIGVGLDYDEHTLAALAVQSSGRLYHLEHPAQMAVILQEELDLLSRTVATNAWIEIVPVPGVEVLDVASLGARVESGRIHVPIGNLHAGQRREVLFRARVDTSRPGARSLASARFGYVDPSAPADQRVQSLSLAYEVTSDRDAAERSGAPEVAAMVATHEAAQARLRASALLNEGRHEEAARQLDFAADAVAGAIQAAPAAPAAARLRRQEQGLRTGSRRAAGASSQSEARGAALEAAEAAYGDMGF